ncbi:MAG: L-rhamnose mutarotase [Deltaproteobacteria bacterium]|nr:L-rhamnose mutarotase [Deltaproteobacteria bacterium]
MNGKRRYCQALDLRDDPALIAEYEEAHRLIWPEIAANIRAQGVLDMEIWRIGTRLFMIMDVDDSFSFDRAAVLADAEPAVGRWEKAMWKYQVPTPWTLPGGKWTPMERVFSLAGQPAGLADGGPDGAPAGGGRGRP